LLSFLLCACATIVALEKLYSRWATGPLFDYQVGHMLEKVENPWSKTFAFSLVSKEIVKLWL